MLNIFEHPWLLIVVSFVLLIAVYIFRSSFPEKRRWWQLLIPAACIALAIFLDYAVKTDSEKINLAIKSGIRGAMNNDIEEIGSLFAEDYRDRYHKSKQAVMNTCRRLLKARSYEKITRTHYQISQTGDSATVDVLLRVHFIEQNSTNPAPDFVYVRLKLKSGKQQDGSWAMTSTDAVEVNNNPLSWNSVR